MKGNTHFHTKESDKVKMVLQNNYIELDFALIMKILNVKKDLISKIFTVL